MATATTTRENEMTTTLTRNDYLDALAKAAGPRDRMGRIERKRLAACRVGDRANSVAAWDKAMVRVGILADEYQVHYDAWKAASDEARRILDIINAQEVAA